MSELEGLLKKVQARHFLYPPAAKAALRRFEKKGLPEDALRFYARMNGACLHQVSEYAGWRAEGGVWWKWVLLPLEQLQTVQERGYMPPDSLLYKASAAWFAVVDVQDGNYLALNVASGHAGEVIDCFHETVGDPGWNCIVAPSFTTMLNFLLSSSKPFWLRKKHRQNGAY